MKIVVPSYVIPFNLNDHQLVLMALLLAIERKLGRGAHKEEFIFYATDFKHIVDNGALPHGQDANMVKLQQVIDISYYGELNWGVSFKTELKKINQIGSNNNTLKEEWTELTDIKAIAKWCYLIGRLADKTLIQDNNGSPFPHKRSNPLLPKNLFKQFCTAGE